MLIELVGCTSAGKSTLIGRMRDAEPQVALDHDVVLGRLGLARARNHVLRTLVVDLLAIHGCLLGSRAHFRLYVLIAKLIWRLPTTVKWPERLNLMRNAFKRLGVYELLRRTNLEQQLVLLDEGTLHIAHNLFVHESVEANPSDFAQFVRLVPKPDIVVYVKQNTDVLVDRTLRRGHKRLRNASPAAVARFVERAVAIFDQIAQEDTLRSKLLTVEHDRQVSSPRDSDSAQALTTVSELIRKGFRMTKTNEDVRKTPSRAGERGAA